MNPGAWCAERSKTIGAVLVAMSWAVTLAGCGRSPEAEADAVTGLKKVGAFTVADNNSGFVRVVDLSVMPDPSQTSEAIQRASELSEPKSLTIIGVDLSDEDVSAIAGMSSLVNVNLTSTNVDDSDLETLSKLKNIQSLTLVDADITDQALQSIGKLTKIKVLGLGKNELSGSFAPLAKLDGLTWLDLGDMELTDETILSLAALRGLQRVTLLNSQYSRDALSQLRGKRNDLQFDEGTTVTPSVDSADAPATSTPSDETADASESSAPSDEADDSELGSGEDSADSDDAATSGP